MPAVVLVHGIFDNGGIFTDMRRRLEQEGLQTFAIDLKPASGWRGIVPLAQQLAAFIDALPNTGRLDLVGFSMGGIVVRYYLQRLAGAARVRRLVTIASPHLGTRMGYTFPVGAGRDLSPGSALLTDLNADAEHLADHAPLSLWTPYDLMILPRRSAILPLGASLEIPVLWHKWMATDRRILEAVVQHLVNKSDT